MEEAEAGGEADTDISIAMAFDVCLPECLPHNRFFCYRQICLRTRWDACASAAASSVPSEVRSFVSLAGTMQDSTGRFHISDSGRGLR